MAQVNLVNYEDASDEVRAVFDDIMKTRNTDYINNIWRALASNPPVLKRFWTQMKEVMIKPSRLDPLTKELIYLAVSINNNCDYCINSHTFAARKHGLDDEMLAELTEVIGAGECGQSADHRLAGRTRRALQAEACGAALVGQETAGCKKEDQITGAPQHGVRAGRSRTLQLPPVFG